MPFRKKKSKEEQPQKEILSPNGQKNNETVNKQISTDNVNENKANLHSQVPEVSVPQEPTLESISKEKIVEEPVEEPIKLVNQSLSAEEANAEINHLLLSIVSGFSDYFIGVATSIFEKTPQNINFDSIRSDRKIGTTGIQLVSVNFSCEFGKVQAGLAVKVYKSPKDLPPIVEKINFLSDRLKPYYSLGVSTAKIIFQKSQILVMEGITGESFRHSTVPISEKYRLAGKCLAALHGHEKSMVNTQHYRELEYATIETLPISSDAKNFIKTKFQEYPLEQYAKESGAISFGDFHAGNLLYEINLYKSPLLMAHLIDPEFLQTEAISDRFEDIANFFVTRAIQEYQMKGKLFQITRELRSFLAGYDEILAYKLKKLKLFYPKSDTFNYHLALGIVLSILNLMSLNEAENTAYLSSQMELRLKLAVQLLESPSIIRNKGNLTELTV